MFLFAYCEFSTKFSLSLSKKGLLIPLSSFSSSKKGLVLILFMLLSSSLEFGSDTISLLLFVKSTSSLSLVVIVSFSSLALKNGFDSSVDFFSSFVELSFTAF